MGGCGPRLQLTRAGHILRAASVHVRHDGQSVVFAGDLGTHTGFGADENPPGPDSAAARGWANPDTQSLVCRTVHQEATRSGRTRAP